MFIIVEHSNVLFPSFNIFLNVIQLSVIVVQRRVGVSEWKAVQGETCTYSLKLMSSLFILW